MESIDHIPTSKIQRASKLLSTGAKVGVNYVKYYTNKLVNTEEEARAKLNEDNAEDIYNSLKSLKGSALKVAQMLSMDKSVLPQAYVEKFSLSQFNVPPLSSALVIKTFREYFGESPYSLFDEFELKATNAASIGQVHKAKKDGQVYAIKIQYPGVAKSISSDLAMVKPIALRMFNISAKDSDQYFKEVENKLIEETDYELEVEQSQVIAKACQHISGLKFPNYYAQWSSQRIITMDWMEGIHLSEFTQKNDDLELGNQIGQTLWDFYMFQIHKLKKVQADPHPGNFLISENNELIALDFGCMKTIPEDFYAPYFELASGEVLNRPEQFEKKLEELEILKSTDTAEDRVFFRTMFHELLSLFARPFQSEYFDFSDEGFFNEIASMGEQYSKNTELRKMDANRGSKHFIYMNRTFFGLYNLLHDLKGHHIKINNI